VFAAGNSSMIFWLVVLTILKNMKVSWDDDIPNKWKNKSHVAAMFQTTKQVFNKVSRFSTIIQFLELLYIIQIIQSPLMWATQCHKPSPKSQFSWIL